MVIKKIGHNGKIKTVNGKNSDQSLSVSFATNLIEIMVISIPI
tara:strand:+ start:515 stop:643 length:129 start_codon:yes stop_codon:yes gene_type:complete